MRSAPGGLGGPATNGPLRPSPQKAVSLGTIINLMKLSCPRGRLSQPRKKKKQELKLSPETVNMKKNVQLHTELERLESGGNAPLDAPGTGASWAMPARGPENGPSHMPCTGLWVWPHPNGLAAAQNRQCMCPLTQKHGHQSLSGRRRLRGWHFLHLSGVFLRPTLSWKCSPEDLVYK